MEASWTPERESRPDFERGSEAGGMDSQTLGVLIALLAVLLSVVLGVFLTSRKPARPTPEDSAKEEKSEASKGARQSAKGKKAQGHKHVGEKATLPHHYLDLNTLKGHADSVTGLAFSADGRALATACEDGVVRVFKLEDVAAKSFKFLRITLPAGTYPKRVAFGEGAGHLLVSAWDSRGGCLLMFGPGSGKEADDARRQGKLPPPEIKWEKRRAHNGKEILTTVSASATYGTGDGSTIAATCSQDGTDVHLWSVADGKEIAKVDSNQLQNTMAALSPDGRFLAVAAFTSDVKVWELMYGKDGSVRDVVKVMQLKGHKSAVTWLCFSWDGKRVTTASKDGTIKTWNLDVRYNVNEDPKCLSTLPIPDPPPSLKKGKEQHVLERIALSPDGKILAATFGHTVQWLDAATGEVLSTAETAHEGSILWAAWSPRPHRTEKGPQSILATAGADKKVKLWVQPE